MKTFTFIVIICIASIGFVQAVDLPLDFESGTYDITNFDGGQLTIIDNNQASGINTSAKVGQMVKNTGEFWAGSYITLDNPIDFTSATIFKMKVFSPKVGTKVLLKVENTVDENIYFEQQVLTKEENSWEELIFDFRAINTAESYRRVIIIFDMGTVGNGSSDFTYLLDDIILEEGVFIPDDAPQIAPPVPPVFGKGKFISIFSDAFVDVDGTNFNPYWQQSTVGSVEDYNGNQVLQLTNLNYQGMELFVPVNAASMKYLHVDVWTADETSLDIYPISKTTGEKKIPLSPLVKNEWNSYDIKLSDIVTSNFNLADLHQFKFVGAGGHKVYIDNLYFYDDNEAADTEVPQAFTATLSTITYNSIKLLMKATDNSGAVNFVITVGGNTVTLGAASGVQKTYEFTRLPSASEFTFNIDAKDLSGNGASNNSIQLVASTDVAFAVPVAPATVPPERAVENVLSIFSNSYTNITGTNFNPYWQQSTWYESMFIGENEMVKYENFNYQGIEIGRKVNASGMKYLHIDVWTPNETSLSISPISQATGEKSVKLTPLNKNEWNSYDIALTSFTIQGMSIADILHLKLVGSGKSIIYVDNIYFYKESTTNLADIKSRTDILLYPNPVSNVLRIESKIEIRNIDIFTLTGQLITSSTPGSLNTTLDLNNLSQGTYIVSTTLINGSHILQKVSKK